MKNIISGLLLVLLVSLSSLYISRILEVYGFVLSPLLISVIIGGFCSFLYKQNSFVYSPGISFSAKRLLRFGIILYGFNVTLGNIASVGVAGIAISVIVVILIFIIGIIVGKFLKLDREIALLVSGGSGICGAAAVLALESSIKSQPYKGVIAVGTVVIFGLISMFIYPLAYKLGLVPFNDIQEGFYIGATLHEVANVVGASSGISPESQNIALIIKMIRVLLLVPTLLLLPLFFSTLHEGSKRKLHIPWFALGFLAVIIIHSFVDFPDSVVDGFRFISLFCLTMAMSALGLQVDLSKFKSSGQKAFVLAGILLLVLIFGGYGLISLFIHFNLLTI